MEEAPFLCAVDRIVGGVEVQDDLLQRAAVVGDLSGVARVGQGCGQPEPAVHFTKQQGPGIGGQPAAVEIGDALLPAETGKAAAVAGYTLSSKGLPAL